MEEKTKFRKEAKNLQGMLLKMLQQKEIFLGTFSSKSSTYSSILLQTAKDSNKKVDLFTEASLTTSVQRAYIYSQFADVEIVAQGNFVT